MSSPNIDNATNSSRYAGILIHLAPRDKRHSKLNLGRSWVRFLDGPLKKIARPQDSHVVTWPAGDQEKHDSLGLLLRAHPWSCSGALPREHRNSGLKTGGALVLHQSSPRHKGSGQRLLLRRRRINCASLVRWSNTSGKPLSVPQVRNLGAPPP